MDIRFVRRAAQTILAATCLALASGCANTPKEWARPGAVETDLEVDKAYCKSQSIEPFVDDDDVLTSLFTIWAYSVQIDSCMEDLGWTLQEVSEVAVDDANSAAEE